jgi:acyl carrier protein
LNKNSSHDLYNIIADVMNVPVSTISEASSAETIEKWDSFRALVLLNELEIRFGVKFSLDEVLNTKTVSDIKRNLQSHGVMLKG